MGWAHSFDKFFPYFHLIAMKASGGNYITAFRVLIIKIQLIYSSN